MTSSDHVTDRAYLSGRVVRYSCWPTLHNQTVGEHTWAVMLLYVQLFGRPRPEVWEYMLTHDSAELVVGDPPFPIKANNPDLKQAYDRLEPAALARMGLSVPEITPEEKAQVKVADLLEMTVFGMVELEMGNRLAIPIIHRTAAKAMELAHTRLGTGEQLNVGRWVGELAAKHETILAAHPTLAEVLIKANPDAPK